MPGSPERIEPNFTPDNVPLAHNPGGAGSGGEEPPSDFEERTIVTLSFDEARQGLKFLLQSPEAYRDYLRAHAKPMTLISPVPNRY